MLDFLVTHLLDSMSLAIETLYIQDWQDRILQDPTKSIVPNIKNLLGIQTYINMIEF